MITIHQPDFLPYMGFFNKARLCDILVIGDHVQYSDKGYTNRVKIKTANGANWLTVSNKHRFGQPINEIKISKERDEFWYEKHLKTLQFCYGKAKFFEEYVGKFESIYKKNYELLVDLNLDFIKLILEILGYDVPIKKTSEMNLTKSKNEGIIEICKNLGADSYLSGMGGLRYIDETIFKENEVKLFFNKYEHPTYQQQFTDLGFIPGLSILDLIFNEGPNSSKVLESGFHGF